MLAKTGRKPKPSLLRAREGHRGHRPIVPDPLLKNPKPKSNGIDPPIELSGRHAELWDEYIRHLPWVTWADVHTALMWVKAAAYLEKVQDLRPKDMREFRTMSSVLGLDPSSRAERVRTPEEKVVSKFSGLIGKD